MNNLILQDGAVADTVTEKHMNLYARIAAWAEQRNFREGATLEGQSLKLAEEFGEFLKHYNKGSDCTDDVGDVLVVVTVLRYMLGINVKHPAYCKAGSGGDVGANIVTVHNAISQFMGMALNANGNTPYKNMMQSELYRIELCMAAICDAMGYNVVACLQHSYIKDRTGKMINGKFVKSADLLEEHAIRSKHKVTHLRSDCSSLCSEGEPCMVSSSGLCDCDRSPEYPPEV